MYQDKQINRIAELYRQIEANKTHEYAAPTYKDSPALCEIADIILSETEDSVEVLEEKIPTLWYLTKCYDEMCRWGMSDKYYKLLLKCHAKLMTMKKYSKTDMTQFENAFYNAVKYRNQYGHDTCEDLVEIVYESFPDERIIELKQQAIESRIGLPKYDPVEKTDKYLNVIDLVEDLVEKNKTMDFCLEYWSLKAEYLEMMGVHWQSPATLNPHILFD